MMEITGVSVIRTEKKGMPLLKDLRRHSHFSNRNLLQDKDKQKGTGEHRKKMRCTMLEDMTFAANFPTSSILLTDTLLTLID